VTQMPGWCTRLCHAFVLSATAPCNSQAESLAALFALPGSSALHKVGGDATFVSSLPLALHFLLYFCHLIFPRRERGGAIFVVVMKREEARRVPV